MPLLRLQSISLGFGGPALLEDVNLSVEPGERICLIGRNGAGKSTLMKVIRGEIKADGGERVLEQGTVITQLEQAVPEGTDGSVYEVVASGLAEAGQLLKDFNALNQRDDTDSQDWLKQMETLQQKLDACDGWQYSQQIEQTLSRLNLDKDVAFNTLSGGVKRRVLLARALVRDPDILLLDEPTNHLDISVIEWLEDFLLSYKATLIFITHDRSFLRRLATRIVELDRGRLSSWPGDYDNFLRRKAEHLEAEAQEAARFDKKLAQEEVWIRQGIKARRTRNEGRVRALKKMRNEFAARRKQVGQANIHMDSGEKSGSKVVEAERISYAINDKQLVDDFSMLIQRGERIGLIGPNGVGKTTLLRLLLDRLQPDSGTVTLGTNLQVAYFDQLRDQLDESATVKDSLDHGADKITVNGKDKHVISYLQDFLFTPDRANSPVRSLSGGERSRLLLARLFIKPANMLVLDEPTNDLDVDTLELLEELLLAYEGTIMVVSHDRTFINNLVTSCLVFEGEGIIREYVGSYDECMTQQAARQQGEPSGQISAGSNKAQSAPSDKNQSATDAIGGNTAANAPNSGSANGNAGTSTSKPATKSGKLSYKLQRELEQLPAEIETLETNIAALEAEMAKPDFYQQAHDVVTERSEHYQQLQTTLEEKYERWETLMDQSA